MIAATPGPTRIERIKKHVKDNKNVYIVGATCLTVGALSGALLAKNADVINITAEGAGHQIVGKAKTVNQIMVEMVERSTPSKPVHLVGTNLYFNSLSEAARETGHHLSLISRNINGHIPDINGDVFELLELAS